METSLMRSVVIAEYCFIFCLCLLTLVLRCSIHRHKSIRCMWKTCSSLCALLLVVIPMAIVYLFMPVLWIAAILGALDNEPKYAYLLAMPVLVEIALDYVYCSVTVVIFLQRIFYLLFPVRKIRKFNLVIYTIFGVFAVGSSIVIFMIILSNLSPDERPLPPGCYSFNCLATRDVLVRPVSSAVTTIFSGVIVGTGSVMFYLVFKHRKQSQKQTCVKMNTFTLYVFYIRLVFQAIPFCLDVALSQTAGIQLGKYLGPYGAIGAILDITATTAVYYKMYKPPKQIVPATTQQTLTNS